MEQIRFDDIEALESKVSEDFGKFGKQVEVIIEIHCRSRVASVEAKPKGTRIEMMTEIHVVGQDIPVLVYSEIMLFMPPSR